MKKSSIFKITTGVLVALIFLAFSVPGYAQTANEKILQDLAAANFHSFLEKIPPGMETGYGFNNPQEFSSVSVGLPFQTYIIVPDSLKGMITLNKNYLLALDEWRIPLMVNGQNRALLTAEKQNGTWQIVDFGAASLAKEIGDFDGQHSSLKNKRKVLLRLYQYQCDFIILHDQSTDAAQGEVYPLHSAARLLKEMQKPVDSAYSFEEFLVGMKVKLLQDKFINEN